MKSVTLSQTYQIFLQKLMIFILNDQRALLRIKQIFILEILRKFNTCFDTFFVRNLLCNFEIICFYPELVLLSDTDSNSLSNFYIFCTKYTQQMTHIYNHTFEVICILVYILNLTSPIHYFS